MKVKRPFFLFIFFIFLVASPAAAQEDNSTRNVVAELDEATWISDINWNPENSSGNIKVQIYSEIPKQVSIQEIPDYSGRSGEFQPASTTTLQVGENNILVPVNGRSTLGIALADSNNGLYHKKSTDSIPEPSTIDVPLVAAYGVGSTLFFLVFFRWSAKLKLSKGYVKE